MRTCTHTQQAGASLSLPGHVQESESYMGLTPLMYAVLYNHFDMLKEVREGASERTHVLFINATLVLLLSLQTKTIGMEILHMHPHSHVCTVRGG